MDKVTELMGSLAHLGPGMVDELLRERKGGDNMTRRAKLQASLDALGIDITLPVGGIDGAVEFLYNETNPEAVEPATLEERVAALEARIG